ncbi:MAG: hypothetical protein ACP5OE_10205, partial [Thermodesulfobium sp.]
MNLNLTLKPAYVVTGGAGNFTTVANVTVFMNATGNFDNSYGSLLIEIYNGSSYLNYSNYVALSPGKVVAMSFPIPTSMLLSHEMYYTVSVYPGLNYTQRTVYSVHLNQSLLASISKVKYAVVGNGIGSAMLMLNFSVSSLIAENGYAVYLNGVRQLYGFVA